MYFLTDVRVNIKKKASISIANFQGSKTGPLSTKNWHIYFTIYLTFIYVYLALCFIRQSFINLD